MQAEQIRAGAAARDTNLTIQPVLDLAEKISVDGYEIPTGSPNTPPCATTPASSPGANDPPDR